MKDNMSFSIFRLSLSVGLNYVRYMDKILIFRPNWTQNTILPYKFQRERRCKVA